MVHYSLLGCSSDVFQSHPIASPLRRSNPACGEPDRPQKLHHIMSTENPDRIIRINAVLARTGLTRSTLYRKVQNGTFPKQLKLSARSEEHTSELQSLMRIPYA